MSAVMFAADFNNKPWRKSYVHTTLVYSSYSLDGRSRAIRVDWCDRGGKGGSSQFRGRIEGNGRSGPAQQYHR